MMAIEYLKRGKPEADRAEDDAKTAAIVSETLKDIEERGDIAVRELANKLRDRDSYRLSEEIEAIIAKVLRKIWPIFDLLRNRYATSRRPSEVRCWHRS